MGQVLAKVKEKPGISKLIVGGFKSIAKRTEIEIRPLTVFCGANSSGKSSAMQPLLLMKQTLESPYDPGILKLDGPNVRFTAADQFLSCFNKKHKATAVTFGIEYLPYLSFESRVQWKGQGKTELQEMKFRKFAFDNDSLKISDTINDVEKYVGSELRKLLFGDKNAVFRSDQRPLFSRHCVCVR